MNIFKNMFGGKSETSQEKLLGKVIEFEMIFSGEVLENPNIGDVDVDSYKNTCYVRCEQYQKEIEKKGEELRDIINKNDGSITEEKVQIVESSIINIATSAKGAAEKFYKILAESNGKGDDVKKELNEASYAFSVEARKQCRTKIQDLKKALLA